MSWRFLASGVVELTLQEAYAADWTDPLPGDYQVVGINVGPAPGSYLPYPPTALTTLSLPGAIQFNITLPSQVLPGTTIELWEYTASTPFSSATLVWYGTVTNVLLGKSDIVTRYYWVRTRGPNNQTSPTYPAVTGVSGVALTPSDSVWVPWVAAGNCIVADTNAMKSGGVAAWGDSCIYSVKGYPNCHISAKINDPTVGNQVMFGFSTNPTASYSFTNANYAWYADTSSNNWRIFESGALIATFGALFVSDRPSITYDGTNVIYSMNGTVQRTVGAAGLTLYGFCPFFSPGAGINSLLYGPTTNLKINDTTEINLNAVSQVVAANSSGTTTVNYPIAGTIIDTDMISATVLANGLTVGIDASVDFKAYSSNNNFLTSCLVTIRRDGADIGTAQFDAYAAYNAGTLQFWEGQVTLTVIDTPAAGSHTYTCHAKGSGGGTFGNPGIRYTNPMIKLRDYKR